MANIKLRQKVVTGSQLSPLDQVKFYNASEKDIQNFTLSGLTNFFTQTLDAESLGIQSYNDFFRGSISDEPSMPASGSLGQWLIRTDLDTIWVWDVEGGSWKETGASGAASSDHQRLCHQLQPSEVRDSQEPW